MERYDGQSPINAFLAQYKICAKHNQRTDAKRLSQLTCSLTGNAVQVLWVFNASRVISWTDLVSQLCARYGTFLAQDIRHLMALTYPGLVTVMSETIAFDAFLVALIDLNLH